MGPCGFWGTRPLSSEGFDRVSRGARGYDEGGYPHADAICGNLSQEVGSGLSSSRSLSSDVLTLADVMGSADKNTAESIAASLPPAPRCPL
jgi:hypothetical protein